MIGQVVPVPSRPAVGTIFAERPVEGTNSRPSRIIWSAVLKKLMPLQNDTWPKTDPRPLTQLPCASAFGVAPTWIRSVPLNPKSMVTIACRGSFGTTGATAGVVPWVMTSGLYTDSAPVRGFRMVAWTNAPRLAALVIVQPDAAGEVPSGPVSWYGVARPLALSGFAGTMMSQLTLAAAAAAAAAAAVVVGAADAAATAPEALADGLAEAPRAD